MKVKIRIYANNCTECESMKLLYEFQGKNTKIIVKCKNKSDFAPSYCPLLKADVSSYEELQQTK